MKVRLIGDVKDVGAMGDVVDVKDGYARNFLFPENLAKIAINSNLKIIEDIKKKKQKRSRRRFLLCHAPYLWKQERMTGFLEALQARTSARHLNRKGL